MNQKVEITKYVVEKLQLKSPTEKTFKAWIHAIWQNPRSKDRGGLRLTERGFEILTKADIRSHKVMLEDDFLIFDSKFILWLDRTFNCPFFIDSKKIYFFSEEPAVQLILFSGKLRNFYYAHQRFSEKQQVD